MTHGLNMLRESVPSQSSEVEKQEAVFGWFTMRETGWKNVPRYFMPLFCPDSNFSKLAIEVGHLNIKKSNLAAPNIRYL